MFFDVDVGMGFGDVIWLGCAVGSFYVKDLTIAGRWCVLGDLL